MRTPKPWSHVFLNMAFDLSFRSKDDSTQAGAILVDANNRIMGTGFNGPPPQMIDDLVPWDIRHLGKFNKYDCVIHAEENCILDALSKSNREDILQSVLYCTHYPCPGCVLRCMHAGISRIVYVRDYKNEENHEKITAILSCQKLHPYGPLVIEKQKDFGL